MGLIGWRECLFCTEPFGNKEERSLENAVHVASEQHPCGCELYDSVVYIKDMMLALRAFGAEGGATMAQLEGYFRRIVNECFGRSDIVVLGFDEHVFCTKAKAGTQAARNSSILPVAPSHPGTYFHPELVLPSMNALFANFKLRRFLFSYLVKAYFERGGEAGGAPVFREAQVLVVAGIGTIPYVIRAHSGDVRQHREYGGDSSGDAAGGGRLRAFRTEMVHWPEAANCIGEFDICAAMYVRLFAMLYPNRAITVDSTDGDMVPILLLEEQLRTESVLAADTDELGLRIERTLDSIGLSGEARHATAYDGANNHFGRNTQVFLAYSRTSTVNITLLRRQLLARMAACMPGLAHPLAHVVLGLVVGGTDFFGGVRGMSREFIFAQYMDYLRITVQAETGGAPRTCSPLLVCAPWPARGVFGGRLEGQLRVLGYQENAPFAAVQPGVCDAIVSSWARAGMFVRQAGFVEMLRLAVDRKRDKNKNFSLAAAPGFACFVYQTENTAMISAYIRRVEYTLTYWLAGYAERGGAALFHTDPLLPGGAALSAWGYELCGGTEDERARAEAVESTHVGLARAVAHADTPKHVVTEAEAVVSQRVCRLLADAAYACCDADAFLAALLAFRHTHAK